MLEFLRKTIVITAIFSLLLPSFCLAATGPCACSDEEMSTTVCECCCVGKASTFLPGCPHCRTQSKPATDDNGDSFRRDMTCHCEVTTPLPTVSLFNWDGSAADGAVTLALEANLAPYLTVCSRDQQSLEYGNSLSLPDTRFRQIILCVWLT